MPAGLMKVAEEPIPSIPADSPAKVETDVKSESSFPCIPPPIWILAWMLELFPFWDEFPPHADNKKSTNKIVERNQIMFM
jgi:hypothetical protein